MVFNKKDNAWDFLSDLVWSLNPTNPKDRMHNIKHILR